jgi:hypothetical protein
MHLLLMSLEAIGRICTQKSPMHKPARKLPTRGRKETRNLVLILLSESPIKLKPKNIVTSARNMGARILGTI